MKSGSKVTMTKEAFKKMVDRISSYKARERMHLKAIEYYERVIKKLNRKG